MSDQFSKSIIIIAIGSDVYDGVILKIEQDDYGIKNEWESAGNLHDFLELRHEGKDPGVYRVTFSLDIDETDGHDQYFHAKNPYYEAVSWPDCQPLFDPKTDSGPAETVI